MKLSERVDAACAIGMGGWVTSIHILAEHLDKQETQLERVREAIGYAPDWSPIHDRRIKAPTNSPVKWRDKASAMNGAGDIAPLLKEMAAGMDVLDDKLGEAVDKLTAPVADKRGPGRPKKDAA